MQTIGGHEITGTDSPWETDGINNILRVPPEERPFSGKIDYSGKKVVLRPK